MTSPEGRPEGMATPESATPEEIAAKLIHGGPPFICTEAEYNGPDYTCNSCDEVVAALKARGEEERAKALEDAARECEWSAVVGDSLLRDIARRIRSLAAAPSGDAKAAAPETVAEHLARMGSPAHSICSECPEPAGDAKGECVCSTPRWCPIHDAERP